MIDLLVHCPEPDNAIRRVRPLRIEPKEVLGVVEKAHTVPNLFEKGVFESINDLYDPGKLFLLVDNVGILCIVPHQIHDVPLSLCAHVHITFWDKRLRGRENLCRAVAREFFAKNPLMAYLWSAVPRSSRATLAFAKRVGFKESPLFHKDKDPAVLVLPREALHGS